MNTLTVLEALAAGPCTFLELMEATGNRAGRSVIGDFAALYALNASLRYLESIGVAKIAAHADSLVASAEAGLRELGVKPMCRWNGSGILAFQHPRGSELHAALERENVHVMHQAGRIRVAVHGYNTQGDIEQFLQVLGSLLEKA